MIETANDIVSLNDLIGKEVQIYPGDTHQKFGKIVEITDAGILFAITRSDINDSSFMEGTFHFIAFSAKLSFRF